MKSIAFVSVLFTALILTLDAHAATTSCESADGSVQASLSVGENVGVPPEGEDVIAQLAVNGREVRAVRRTCIRSSGQTYNLRVLRCPFGPVTNRYELYPRGFNSSLGKFDSARVIIHREGAMAYSVNLSCN